MVAKREPKIEVEFSARTMSRVLRTATEFIAQKLAESWHSSSQRHSRWLKKDSGKRRLVLSVFLYVVLTAALIESDLKLGISFAFAGLAAICSGWIYKNDRVMLLVLAGVAIATVPTLLLLQAKIAFSHADWISVILLAGLGIAFWNWSRTLKRGEMPQEWTERKKSKRVGRKRQPVDKV
jgi:hypothetical protein